MKASTTFGTGILLAALIDLSAIAQPAAPLAYIQPLPPAAVQSVQQHLRSAGAYSGAVDGVWGPDSAAALQRFQASHQLQATGQLNQATAAALGLDSAALLGTQQATEPPLPPPDRLQGASVRAIQEHRWHLGPEHAERDPEISAKPRLAAERTVEPGNRFGNGAATERTRLSVGVRPRAQASPTRREGVTWQHGTGKPSGHIHPRLRRPQAAWQRTKQWPFLLFCATEQL
ncbi:MAG TPA: peptidoglycan-binding domain-containing protein [Rhodopila sp.]|nr:peptidoglycan-binding domain-containing protein [Rhodopila sp.]